MFLVVGASPPLLMTSQSYPVISTTTVPSDLFSLLLTFEYGPISANTSFYFYLQTENTNDPRPIISPFNNSYFTVEYEL